MDLHFDLEMSSKYCAELLIEVAERPVEASRNHLN
jgi:hypothetical protein